MALEKQKPCKYCDAWPSGWGPCCEAARLAERLDEVGTIGRKAMAERDELRAEVERLRAVLWTCDVHPDVINPPGKAKVVPSVSAILSEGGEP